MNPLGELTIATHGRGGQRSGSVTVRAASSIGGVLRFDIPNLGVAGVGDSPTVRDALLPVRRQDGGINTGVAVRNRGTATLTLQCRLMRDGAVVEEADIRLNVNGQDSRFIDEVFPAADTSDFTGSVRCAAPEPGRFSAVAFELDGVHRVFTTLPVVPVPAVLDQEQEQEEEQEQDATRLDFTHFANGGKIVSSLVLVNAGTDPVRPAIHFHDQDGDAIPAESLVDITDDLEVDHHGALRPGAAMNPLGELTISTHGRGVLKVGSVAVMADGPIGGVLRFDIPGFGVAGVGDSPPVRDALVPVRRQDGGINTGVAVHNRGEAALLVRCRLMQGRGRARRDDDPACRQRPGLPVHRPGVPCRRYLGLRRVGAVHDARTGTLLGGGLRTGRGKPDLHDPARRARGGGALTSGDRGRQPQRHGALDPAQGGAHILAPESLNFENVM